VRKLSVLVAMIVLLVPALASAQSYKPTFGSVTSGQDALASGLTGTIQFENEKERKLEVVFQQEQAWVLWGPKVKVGPAEVFVAGSVGYMQGAPWAGPLVSVDLPIGKVGGQKVSVSTFHWPCFFFGQWEPTGWRYDGKPPNPEAIKYGYLGSVSMSIGPLSFSYGALDFLDDPWNAIPGVAYKQNVTKTISVSGSVSRNINTKSWMFLVGASWQRPDPEKEKK